MAAQAGLHQPLVEGSLLCWKPGNPNKGGNCKAKGADESPIRGVPPEERQVIELTEEYFGPTEMATQANLRFVQYLNGIKDARIQIYEAIFDLKMIKKKGKGKRGEKRPCKHEVQHMKAGLKKLMARMDHFKRAVLQAGGIPFPVPRHFRKDICV